MKVNACTGAKVAADGAACTVESTFIYHNSLAAAAGVGDAARLGGAAVNESYVCTF